jgi:hypothetical protein
MDKVIVYILGSGRMFIILMLTSIAIIPLVYKFLKPKNEYKSRHSTYDTNPKVGKYWHPYGTIHPYLWMKSIDSWIEGRKADPETIAKMYFLKAHLKEKWDRYNEMKNWKWLELYRSEQYQW